MKMSFMLVAGVANFTRLVQISIVNNHSWVQNYNDKVPKINVIVLAIIFTFFLKEILYLAILAAFSQLGVVVTEYILVGL